MKRRNYWVLFAILLLALISLSPGADRSYVANDDTGYLENPPLPDREVEDTPGHLTVAVQMEPGAFKLLQQRNELFTQSHQVSVELVNEYGKDAYALFKQKLALHDAPDILLLDNEWIREFAVKGYLLPIDYYFTGAAAGNSLSSLQAYSEWNGYVWAVPKDMDPYVFVYNPDTLLKLGMKKVPASREEWDKLMKSVQELRTQTKEQLSLLAVSFDDPKAFVTLFHRLGGTLTLKDSSGSLSEQDKNAVLLLEMLRPALRNFDGDSEMENVWSQLEQGQAAMALMPYSEFRQHTGGTGLQAETPDNTGAADRMTLFGRSFAVASDTEEAEAAGQWITAMTEAAEQKDAYEQEGLLPALKSLYDASVDNEIAYWLPDGGSKQSYWLPPVSDRTPGLIRQLSVQASEFLSGTASAQQLQSELAGDLQP